MFAKQTVFAKVDIYITACFCKSRHLQNSVFLQKRFFAEKPLFANQPVARQRPLPCLVRRQRPGGARRPGNWTRPRGFGKKLRSPCGQGVWRCFSRRRRFGFPVPLADRASGTGRAVCGMQRFFTRAAVAAPNGLDVGRCPAWRSSGPVRARRAGGWRFTASLSGMGPH